MFYVIEKFTQKVWVTQSSKNKITESEVALHNVEKNSYFLCKCLLTDWLRQFIHSLILLLCYVLHIVDWVRRNGWQWNRRHVVEPWSRDYGLSYRFFFIVVSFKIHPFYLETDETSLSSVIEYRLYQMYLIFPGQETLILMTREFDPLMEFPMHPDAFGEGMIMIYDFYVHNAACIKINPKHENILSVEKWK